MLVRSRRLNSRPSCGSLLALHREIVLRCFRAVQHAVVAHDPIVPGVRLQSAAQRWQVLRLATMPLPPNATGPALADRSNSEPAAVPGPYKTTWLRR